MNYGYTDNPQEREAQDRRTLAMADNGEAVLGLGFQRPDDTIVALARRDVLRFNKAQGRRGLLFDTTHIHI